MRKYYIALYYGKWAIVSKNIEDEPKLEIGLGDKEKERIVELFDTRNEADRFMQGVTFAMKEMNAL
jgi:hypothetical protein